MIKKISLPIIDQGVVSLGNFITTIIIANLLTISDFGLYSLIITTVLTVTGFCNSITTEPVKCLGVEKIGVGDYAYVSSQIILRFLLSISVVVIFFICVYYFKFINIKFFIAISVYIIAYQLYELFRAFLISELDWYLLLFSDLICHSVRVILLLVISSKIILYNFYILNISILLAVLVYFICKDIKLYLRNTNIFSIFVQNYNYGKWIIIENIFFILSTQIYIYLLAKQISIESAGAFNAAQTIVNILNILFMGVSAYAMPNARKLILEQGVSIWKKWLIDLGITVFLLTIFVAIILHIYQVEIIKLFFNESYVEYSYLITYLAISAVLNSLLLVFIIYFRSSEKNKICMYSKMYAAIFSVAIAFLLIETYGILGATIGLILTNSIGLLVYVYFFITLKISKPSRY